MGDDNEFHLTQGLVEGAVSIFLIILIVSGSWGMFSQIGAVLPFLHKATVIGGLSFLPMTDAGIKLQDTSDPNWKLVTNAYLVVPITVNQYDKMWIMTVDQSAINSLGGSVSPFTTQVKMNNAIELDIEPLTPTVSWSMNRLLNFVVCNGANGKYIRTITFDSLGAYTLDIPTITTNSLMINYLRMSSPTIATLSLPFKITAKINGQTTSQATDNVEIKSDTYFPGGNPTTFALAVPGGSITINSLGVLGSNQQLPSDISSYVFMPYSTGNEVTDYLGNKYLAYRNIEDKLSANALNGFQRYWFGEHLSGVSVYSHSDQEALIGTDYEIKPGWRRQELISYGVLGPVFGAGYTYYYYPSQPTLMQDQVAISQDNGSWTWGWGPIQTIHNHYRMNGGNGFFNWLERTYGYQFRFNPADSLSAVFGNLQHWKIANPNGMNPSFVADLSPSMYTNLVTLYIPTTVGNFLVYQNPATITSFEITSPKDGFDVGRIIAGQDFNLNVVVKNTGNTRGTAIVTCKSLDNLLTLYPTQNSITLDPGASGTVTFTLRTGGVSSETTLSKLVELNLYVSGSPTASQTVFGGGTLVPAASAVYFSRAIELVPAKVPAKGSAKAKIWVASQGGSGATTVTINVAVSGPFSVSPSTGTFSINPGGEIPFDVTVSTTESSGGGYVSATLYVNNQQKDFTQAQIQIAGGPIIVDYTLFFLWLLILGILFSVAGFYLWINTGLIFALFTGLGLFSLSIGGFLFGNALINGIMNLSNNVAMAFTAMGIQLSAPMFVFAGLTFTFGMIIALAVILAGAGILFLWWRSH